MLKIAILMTCHNRREKTLRCLRSIAKCSKLTKTASFDVFLVDDGSTDGTAEAVRKWTSEEIPNRFALRVFVICGTGTLFWARGMHLAWKSALEKNDYDYFLWLNDDVELYADSLSMSLQLSYENKQAVIVGKCEKEKDSGVKTYGVNRKWFNGNFVLVSREVAEKVGIISDEYSHARADFDYAERVRRAGIDVVETAKFVGVCLDDWEEKIRGKSVKGRLSLLFLPGNWNLIDLWKFQSRYYGHFRAFLCCVRLILIALRGV